jgi:hypothetical protein
MSPVASIDVEPTGQVTIAMKGSWQEILPPCRMTANPAAASWRIRFGSYFYPVLATAPTWEFRASDSNRCTECKEELRWGFGALPFGSLHPNGLGCNCHCSALGVPEEAHKGDNRWVKKSGTPAQARRIEVT